jgi:hypothetical protein
MPERLNCVGNPGIETTWRGEQEAPSSGKLVAGENYSVNYWYRECNAVSF